MNCEQTRERLPLLIYGDLDAADIQEAESHLADCPDCRRAYDALRSTSRALDSAPNPKVTIDVARIHAQVMATQLRSTRRWKRFAVVSAALAASLIALLLIRPEIEAGRGQLVIRWGPAPVPAVNADNTTVVQVPVRDPDLEARVAVMNRLLTTIQRQTEAAVQEQRDELEILFVRLELLRIMSQQNWDETKRDVGALYTAQFGRRD